MTSLLSMLEITKIYMKLGITKLPQILKLKKCPYKLKLLKLLQTMLSLMVVVVSSHAWRQHRIELLKQ